MKWYDDLLQHLDYLRRDATLTLLADWDIGDGRKILADEIRARDGDGLKLYDDGGNGIFVEDGGYVGVNIANPTSELHVNTTRNTPAMRVQSTHADAANRWAGIEYLESDGSTGVFTGLNGNTNEFRFNNVATSGYINFLIGGSSKMVILNSGYVGVGIAPTSELHVNTTRNTPALRIQSTHATAANRWAGIEYLKSDGNTGVFTGLNGNTNEFRFNNVATSGYINFLINSSSKMIVTNAGKVGVGTTTPAALLDVNGDAMVRGDINELQKLIFKDATELTVVDGSITVTQSRHSIDTQNDDATDDLVTINGGENGQILILNTENSARDVTLKHGTGNILISGGDYTMDSAYNIVMLIYTGTYWMKLM